METVLISGGIVITVFVIIDILWTTLWIDGSGGPITRFVTYSVWLFLKFTVGKLNMKLFSISGAWILFEIVLSWIILLFLGWFLLFLSNDNSVIDTLSGETSNAVDKIYFVAYSLFTLGNGDLKPAKGIWQVLTPCITATGMFTITLSVTYLLSVISAAINKKNFSTQITTIGETAEDFVINLWRGKHFNSVDLQLNSISRELNLLHQQHKAYPVLHYFQDSEIDKSTAYVLSVLDDALSIFEHAINEEDKPSMSLLKKVRGSISNYLETIKSIKKFPEIKESPSPINLRTIRDEGINSVEDDLFLSRINKLDKRRKLLFQLVRSEGWDWYSERKPIKENNEI